MKLPPALQDHLLRHKAREGYLAIEFGPDLRVRACHGNAAHFGMANVHPGDAVNTIHPALATETFDEPFQLPFLNLGPHLVCDLHHVMEGDTRYLLFLDRTEQFDVVSRHQQHSHNIQLSNDHFRRLVDKLTATQTRLHKANEEKAMLIAMLSHEFGTPLAAISGYAELLEKGKITPQKATTVIRRNADALVAMIRNALHYGQLHAGGRGKNAEFSLHNLLEDLRSTLQPLADSKNLRFDIHCSNLPDNLWLDRHRLRQILINLLGNAFKYTRRGQVQLLIDGSKKTNVTFTVRDTGDGIPADKIPRLFTPWVRGAQTQAGGTGLGLVISKQLAESLGGTLRMTDTSKKGTTFQLEVPLNASENPETMAAAENLKGKHVLLVDDDPDILYLCQLLLEEHGLFVITAQTVADAGELFSNRCFDVILTDINLADGHGEAVLDRVRQHSRRLPVLAMSALPHPKTIDRLLQRGFSAVIPKPIDEQVLIETVNQTLSETS